VQRLLPNPGPTTVEQQLSGLDLIDLAYNDRPYVVVNFATTLDGRAAMGGRSGPIGSDTDTEMLQMLRTRVDAVMIGAGTMRAERYGRIVSDPALRARRERIGLPHDPLAVIVSGRLDLPWDAPLFTDGGGRVLIFTASEAEPPQTKTPVTGGAPRGRRRHRRSSASPARGAGNTRPALRGRARIAQPANRRPSSSTSCS